MGFLGYGKKEKKLTVSATIEDVDKQPTDRETMLNVDAYRKRGEEILAVLGDAEVELNKKRKAAQTSENEELLSKLNAYASGLAGIRRKLDNAEACDLDTILIDKKLSKLGKQLIDSIHNDNIETTGRIIASIGYGVKKGRDKISSLDEVDAIMESRERMMECYEIIIRSSKEIDHARGEIKKLDKTLEEGKIKLKELKEAIHNMEVKNPGIIQASQTVRVGTNPNPLVSTYMSLKGAGASQFKSLKDLKLQKTTCENKIYSMQATIENEKMKLQSMETETDQVLKEQIQKSNEEFRIFMEDQVNFITEMQTINGEMDKIMDSIFSSRQWIDYLIRMDEEYNECIEEEKYQREADAQGRKLMQEETQEEEQKLEAELEN